MSTKFLCGHDRTPENTFTRTDGGTLGRCRICKVAYHKTWRAANKEHEREVNRRRLARDPEREQAYGRTYRAAHKEHIQEKDKAWREANKEYQRDRVKAYAVANPERLAANSKAYALANPEKRAESRGRRRASKQGAIISKADYRAILAEFGMVCHICGGVIDSSSGQYDPNNLHFDHVIPLAVGGPHSQDNVRPSHAGCNLSKGTSLLEAYQLAS
jgi:5-methylcytosine-specific restriction endonuclease McrA